MDAVAGDADAVRLGAVAAARGEDRNAARAVDGEPGVGVDVVAADGDVTWSASIAEIPPPAQWCTRLPMMSTWWGKAPDSRFFSTDTQLVLYVGSVLLDERSASGRESAALLPLTSRFLMTMWEAP
ncbi:hypothetical protein [Streptomyces sp. YIM 103828]|uniref:hypothetical protein n=1 Tax=Streptomyces sp. YIM 103828 TaxID=3158968 RepID=UPI0032D8FE35